MIPQINNILYATDLSQNASYAFLYAVDMAKKHNARIVILHSIEPVHHIYSEGMSIYGERMLDKAKKQEREMDLEKMKASIPYLRRLQV